VFAQVAEDYFRWQPHPEVWVLLAGLVGLYVYSIRVLGPAVLDPGTPPATAANKRWFVLGIVLLYAAADWPMHDIGEEYLYSVHMIQHLVLTFFVPPAMLLATPEWLARVVVGEGRAGRWFLKLARPIPAAIVFNTVQLLTHWSGVVNTSVENGLLHYGIHTAVVVTAFAVWMPVVSPLPEYRISPPAQCIHLFLTSIIPTVPAAWLALSEGVIYDAYDKPARLWGISVTSDQQVAGLLMKLGAGGFLWLVIIFLFFRWVSTQDLGTAARRVTVATDGTILDIQGAAPLTMEDLEQEFEATGPPPEESAPLA
jgi:putative membrane protein